jgi:hypothetical protein
MKKSRKLMQGYDVTKHAVEKTTGRKLYINHDKR